MACRLLHHTTIGYALINLQQHTSTIAAIHMRLPAATTPPQVQEAQAVTREMRSRLSSQPGSQELQAALDTAAALERELASVQAVVAVREEELKGVQEAARQQAEQARAALRESQRKVRVGTTRCSALVEAMMQRLLGDAWYVETQHKLIHS
jgi:hypothetical protein